MRDDYPELEKAMNEVFDRFVERQREIRKEIDALEKRWALPAREKKPAIRVENLYIFVLALVVVMLYIAAYWWSPVNCPPGYTDGDDRTCQPVTSKMGER